MPPLWEQRKDLSRQILETLSEYMENKPIEKCRNLAIGYAEMLTDLMPLKKLSLWLDLLKALKERDAE